MSVHALMHAASAQSTDEPDCIIYVLVNDVPADRTGPAVTARIDRGRRYAADHGWDVRKVFADINTTAADWRRPQFRELQEYCRAHADVRYLLIRSEAEVAKSRATWARFGQLLAEHGIEVVVMSGARKEQR